MKSQVKVVKVEKLTSQKGNPFLIVSVLENGALIPMRIAVFNPEQVSNPPAPGTDAILSSDVDYRFNGVLTVHWPISK